VIEATTMDTEISYNSVMISNDITEDKKVHRFERQMKGYAGPDFSTLDERIQTALSEYLDGYGVNEHLAAFVECMSLDKDQRLYMNWLSELKEFVNK
jgi:complement component 1 Q subcomponent-binding protein